jgi:hypothetical protein
MRQRGVAARTSRQVKQVMAMLRSVELPDTLRVPG